MKDLIRTIIALFIFLNSVNAQTCFLDTVHLNENLVQSIKGDFDFDGHEDVYYISGYENQFSHKVYIYWGDNFQHNNFTFVCDYNATPFSWASNQSPIIGNFDNDSLYEIRNINNQLLQINVNHTIINNPIHDSTPGGKYMYNDEFGNKYYLNISDNFHFQLIKDSANIFSIIQNDSINLNLLTSSVNIGSNSSESGIYHKQCNLNGDKYIDFYRLIFIYNGTIPDGYYPIIYLSDSLGKYHVYNDDFFVNNLPLDFNSDGFADFYNSNQILLNTGNLTFEAKNFPFSISKICDYNKDGFHDLVSNNKEIYLNEKDGNFTLNKRLPQTLFNRSDYSFDINADNNNDGINDLIFTLSANTSTNHDSTIYLIYGNNNGFDTSNIIALFNITNTQLPIANHLYHEVYVKAMGDINNDGNDDYKVNVSYNPFEYDGYYEFIVFNNMPQLALNGNSIKSDTLKFCIDTVKIEAQGTFDYFTWDNDTITNPVILNHPQNTGWHNYSFSYNNCMYKDSIYIQEINLQSVSGLILDTVLNTYPPLQLCNLTHTFGVNYWGTGVSENLFIPQFANTGLNTIYFYNCSNEKDSLFIIVKPVITELKHPVDFKFDINFYPNPAQNYLYIELQNNITKNTVKLMDVTGKILLFQNIEDVAKLDLQFLETGIYIAEISNFQKTKRFKFVKK